MYKQVTVLLRWLTSVFLYVVIGWEGVPHLRDMWVETKGALPAGPVVAAYKTKRIPGERDPTAQQGQSQNTHALHFLAI